MYQKFQKILLFHYHLKFHWCHLHQMYLLCHFLQIVAPVSLELDQVLIPSPYCWRPNWLAVQSFTVNE